MHEINVTNVNQALSEGLNALRVVGVEENSRNGPVVVFPEPVVTTYQRPCERVLFSPMRDANPFFHLMESIWMLAGRNDVQYPAFFAKNIAQYSDDGETLNGAYGHRWRQHFGYDQLVAVIVELERDPETRRAVLTMWDATRDLTLVSKDKPCNTHIYFDTRGGCLNMTVCNRSNDLLWGAYGANAVHFSVLQEFVACAIGRPVGVYRQFSNNMHVYTNTLPREKWEALAGDAHRNDAYRFGTVDHYPLCSSSQYLAWLRDAEKFLVNPCDADGDPFFVRVAKPVFQAWKWRKAGEHTEAYLWVTQIEALDWRKACFDWMARREPK